MAVASINSGASGCMAEQQRQLYQGDISNDFKRLVVQLAGALDDEDSRGKMRYLHKDKLGPGHASEGLKALELFNRLEEKGVFSARNVQPLEELLKNIDRCDLVETHLEPFRRKYNATGYALEQHSAAGEKASLHHSMSSPGGTTQPPSMATYNNLPHRSTSFPMPIASAPSNRPGQLSDMSSIQEEHQSPNSRHLSGTGASKKSLLVYGRYASEMSGVGSSSHQSRSEKVQSTEEFSEQSTSFSHAHPVTVAEEGRKKDIQLSVHQMSHDDVTFQVGNDVSALSTQHQDIDSQLNFPMENSNNSESPAGVKSSLGYPNHSDSLGITDALTRSFQQMDKRSRTNIPHNSIVDKTAVEVSDRSDGEACLVAGISAAAKPERESEGFSRPAAPKAHNVDGNTCTALIESVNLDRRSWHLNPEIFCLNREKMATIIAKQKTGHCYKRFRTTILISKSKKGITLTLEIFPFGREGDEASTHATVLVKIMSHLNGRKCQEMTEHCNSVIEVKLTFIDSTTKNILSKQEGQAELNASCEGCVVIDKALSHKDIIYTRTKRIQLQVEATLHCKEKVVAVPSSDPICPDYLMVTSNSGENQSESRQGSTSES